MKITPLSIVVLAPTMSTVVVLGSSNYDGLVVPMLSRGRHGTDALSSFLLMRLKVQRLRFRKVDKRRRFASSIGY